MLVIDANVAYEAALVGDGGFRVFVDDHLAAPPLMWSEVASTLHVAVSRQVVPREDALQALTNLVDGPVHWREPYGLVKVAWKIADELGWHKTYDAEYLALAQLEECAIATFDGRMRMAARRLGIPLWLPPPS